MSIVIDVVAWSSVLHVTPVDQVNKLMLHQLSVKNVIQVCCVSFNYHHHCDLNVM